MIKKLKYEIKHILFSINQFNFFDLQHSWLKFVLFFIILTISGVGFVSYLYTQKAINQMKESTKSIAKGYASVLSSITTEIFYHPTDDKIFLRGKNLTTNFPIPVVITETNGKPRAWQNISIPSESFSNKFLDSITYEQALKVPLLQDIIYTYLKMDEKYDPLPIYIDLGENKVIAAYLHYGPPPSLEKVNYLPLIQTGLLLTLLITLLFAIRIARNWERDNIWMLMAKETAHQLATPLSSIMGWTEFLKIDHDNSEEGYENIEKDLSRMKNIIQRFSRIGTTPILKDIEVNQIVEKAIQYFIKRLPTLGKNVEIISHLDGNFIIKGDNDLISWVFENLIKNALDAMDKKNGKILIKSIFKKNKLYYQIIDNGKGIQKNQFNKIFETGYTSKKHGWGMGLALSKRIVERIHGGRIFVEKSEIGHGTTITLILNIEKKI